MVSSFFRRTGLFIKGAVRFFWVFQREVYVLMVNGTICKNVFWHMKAEEHWVSLWYTPLKKVMSCFPFLPSFLSFIYSYREFRNIFVRNRNRKSYCGSATIIRGKKYRWKTWDKNNSFEGTLGHHVYFDKVNCKGLRFSQSIICMGHEMKSVTRKSRSISSQKFARCRPCDWTHSPQRG